MDTQPLVDRAEALLTRCRSRGIMLASAESCTGGLLGALLTSIPGSSDVYERGFITYSNAAKHELLGVDENNLVTFGAVSAIVAEQMAQGALIHSRSDIAVSVTGIAGPSGGTPEKPVGLVYFGVATKEGTVRSIERRFGDLGRDKVRDASVEAAIDLLLEATGAESGNQARRP